MTIRGNQTIVPLRDNVQRDHYRLRVRASDKGVPPSYADVEVELDVVDRNNKPPIWDKIIYGPIYTKENVVVGTKIASVKARLVFKKKKKRKKKSTPFTWQIT